MKVKRESEVTQSCLTLPNPLDCSLAGSSVHGIFQARVLEWVAIAFSAIHLFSLKQGRGPDTCSIVDGPYDMKLSEMNYMQEDKSYVIPLL